MNEPLEVVSVHFVGKCLVGGSKTGVKQFTHVGNTDDKRLRVNVDLKTRTVLVRYLFDNGQWAGAIVPFEAVECIRYEAEDADR